MAASPVAAEVAGRSPSSAADAAAAAEPTTTTPPGAGGAERVAVRERVSPHLQGASAGSGSSSPLHSPLALQALQVGVTSPSAAAAAANSPVGSVHSDGASTPRSGGGGSAHKKTQLNKSDALQRLNKAGGGGQGSAAAPNPARTKADESWLLQRQLEVELSLRKKLGSEEDIEQVRSLVETLVTFFDELRRASERLGVQLAAVFQVCTCQAQRMPDSPAGSERRVLCDWCGVLAR